MSTLIARNVFKKENKRKLYLLVELYKLKLHLKLILYFHTSHHFTCAIII